MSKLTTRETEKEIIRVTYHINVKGIRIFNRELYGDFTIAYKDRSYKFQKDLVISYSQTIAEYVRRYPRLKCYDIQRTDQDEDLVTRVLSLLAGFSEVPFTKKELISAFYLISELRMSEHLLNFEEKYWSTYLIGIALDGYTALEVLNAFYGANKQFQEKFGCYLDKIYEKVLETNFECFAKPESYLKLPFQVFFTVMDWYIDTVRKRESEEKADNFPMYDVNELTYEYIGHHDLHNDPKSTKVLIDLKNSIPRKSVIRSSYRNETSFMESERQSVNHSPSRFDFQVLKKELEELRQDVGAINDNLKQLTAIVRDHIKICQSTNMDAGFSTPNSRLVISKAENYYDRDNETLTNNKLLDSTYCSQSEALQRRIKNVQDNLSKKIDLMNSSDQKLQESPLSQGMRPSHETRLSQETFAPSEIGADVSRDRILREPKNMMTLDSNIITDPLNRLWLLEQLAKDERYVDNKLLYRASTHGFTADSFHLKCDNQGPTLTIIRANKGIWGGFSEYEWESPKAPVRKEGDSVTWLFNLNKKRIYNPIGSDCNVYCKKSIGPTFGWGNLYGFDLAVGYQFVFKASPQEGDLSIGMVTNGNYITDMCDSGWINLEISEIEVYSVTLRSLKL